MSDSTVGRTAAKTVPKKLPALPVVDVAKADAKKAQAAKVSAAEKPDVTAAAIATQSTTAYPGMGEASKPQKPEATLAAGDGLFGASVELEERTEPRVPLKEALQAPQTAASMALDDTAEQKLVASLLDALQTHRGTKDEPALRTALTQTVAALQARHFDGAAPTLDANRKLELLPTMTDGCAIRLSGAGIGAQNALVERRGRHNYVKALAGARR
ncbi:MAG: hypothetical protein IPJ65_43290 [Archangiaceae bacterium]|nr:hypothetical protein [Archangiaceae bacterium]